MLGIDQNILKLMNDLPRPSAESRAHMSARIVASSGKTVEGKLVFSKAIYQENYDHWYAFFLKAYKDNA